LTRQLAAMDPTAQVEQQKQERRRLGRPRSARLRAAACCAVRAAR